MMAKQVGYHHSVASIAATVAVLGWSVCSGSSMAYSPVETSSSIDPSDMVGGGSSVVVALSESDFADFSLPSYQEVNAAEINTNLKGGKLLFGEEEASISKASVAGDTSSEPTDDTPKKKEPTAADLKAEKAAAKAAQQEARARQQAAVEAAAAAKK